MSLDGGVLINMIIGIGTDIIEVDRIKKAVEKEYFLNKVYTKREVEAFGENYQSLAANYAVKEAVSKAFGTGFRSFSPIDIEVLRDELGKPYVILYNNAKKMSEEQRVSNIYVSISHTQEYAVGYVIFEGI